MAFYYYPLSTRDFAFENIFSTETVSPASYYAVRTFGFDYFPVLSGINNDQAILLFNQPPAYQDENNAKFILRISEDVINPSELVFVTEGVFAYYGTIYFNKEHLRILFFSTKDIRVAILKSNISLPTKTTDKYDSLFETINESDCKAFPLIDAVMIKADDEIRLKVALDKRYNHFKGFIYGLVIGQIANDRKKEASLKIRLQEITNAFAELKSRLDEQPSAKHENEATKKIHLYIEKLFQAIDTAESEYNNIESTNEIDEQLLIEYLLNKITRLKSPQQISNYLDYVITNDELLGTSDYKKIVDGYVFSRKTSSPVFQQLRKYIEQFISVFQSASKPMHSPEDLNNRIKLLLRDATEEHLDQLSTRVYDLKTDLNRIVYDFVSNEVSLNVDQVFLNTKADNEFIFIINAILKFSKSNKGPAEKEMILKIVEEVGSSYTKGGKETLLYQYLDNRIDVYSLDRASNLVMKNFVAFVFNPDSLEKLDNFLMSKEIEERWMAFSFWGAYNGFANISKNYTNDIFADINIKLQTNIDAYLRHYLQMVVNRKVNVLFVEERNQYDTSQIVVGTKEDESILEFFNLYVRDKYKLKVDEFTEVLKIKDKKRFQDELKIKYKILKKDSQKLFNAIKKFFDPNNLFQ